MAATTANQCRSPTSIRYNSASWRTTCDFTRIAASDPKVWRDILSANKDELLAQSRHFGQALQALEQRISQGDLDGLTQLIDQASRARAAWQPSDT